MLICTVFLCAEYKRNEGRRMVELDVKSVRGVDARNIGRCGLFGSPAILWLSVEEVGSRHGQISEPEIVTRADAR